MPEAMQTAAAMTRSTATDFIFIEQRVEEATPELQDGSRDRASSGAGFLVTLRKQSGAATARPPAVNGMEVEVAERGGTFARRFYAEFPHFAGRHSIRIGRCCRSGVSPKGVGRWT